MGILWARTGATGCIGLTLELLTTNSICSCTYQDRLNVSPSILLITVPYMNERNCH